MATTRGQASTHTEPDVGQSEEFDGPDDVAAGYDDFALGSSAVGGPDAKNGKGSKSNPKGEGSREERALLRQTRPSARKPQFWQMNTVCHFNFTQSPKHSYLATGTLELVEHATQPFVLTQYSNCTVFFLCEQRSSMTLVHSLLLILVCVVRSCRHCHVVACSRQLSQVSFVRRRVIHVQRMYKLQLLANRGLWWRLMLLFSIRYL